MGAYDSTGNVYQRNTPYIKDRSPMQPLGGGNSSNIGSSMSLGGASQSSGGSELTALMDKLNGMNGPTLTTQQITQAQRSPELEAQIQAQTGRLNELQTGYGAAYDNKQQTFNDVIQSLINASQARGSRNSQASGTAALQSGLTPMEAAGVGQNSMDAVLQQMWPMLAGLRSDQADVGIGLQNALQGVDQEHAQLLQGVMAPYMKGVAGTTVTGEETDILGIQKLLGSLAMQQSQQQSQDAQMSNAMAIAQMQDVGQTKRAGMAQGGATQRTGMTQAGASDRASAGLSANQQLATQSQDWQSQQNVIARQQEEDMIRLRADLTGGMAEDAWQRESGAPNDLINSLGSWFGYNPDANTLGSGAPNTLNTYTQ